MRVKQVGAFIAFVGIFVCLSTLAVAVPPTWTISGVVVTADGTGVEGVDIVGDNGATAAVTAADGSYSVIVPNHWDGTITVSKIGWLITPPSNTYTDVAAGIANENYTAYQPKISGLVTKSDGTPLAGATVTANNSGGSDTTDANGYYEINVPYNWSGTVSATLTGYNFTDKSYTNVIADQVNQDFTGFQPTISGSTNVAGATVTISGVGVTTSTPNYTVTVPYGWSGTITAELTGYDFTNSPLSYTNVTTDLMNQDFIPFQPTISGSTSVAGATVIVSGVGSVVSTPEYSVTVPYGWSGTVEAALAGYYFAESPRSYTNVTADQSTQSFTPFQPTISGTITEEGGTPVAGVAVAADNGGGSDTTDTNGYYEIIVPYDWSGTVAPEITGLGFTPNERTYATLTANQTNQDYTSHALYGGGSGIDIDPYLIYTAEQMQAIGSNPVDWDKQYKLMADIDLSTFDGIDGRPTFNIIGNGTTKFRGVFDGNSHTVSNFTHNSVNNYVGLFGWISESGTMIVNLTLANVKVNTNADYVGSLVGLADYNSKIIECYLEGGYVTGGSCVGGLIGEARNNEIESCHAMGVVNGTMYYAGGLVGYADDVDILNSSSTCDVSGRNWAGGIAGALNGFDIGATLLQCYAVGEVHVDWYGAGGLVGYNIYAEIVDCYAFCSVSGDDGLGGVAGWNETASIRNCYAAGAVPQVGWNGGLVGRNRFGATINSSFWDIELSGNTSMCGQQDGDSSGCDNSYGKTISQMQTQGTFDSAGWDFSDVWTICNSYDYPYLRWEGYPPCTDISNNTLSFTAISKDVKPVNQVFHIINNCEGVLDWTITRVNACDWLIVLPEEGEATSGNPTEVSLSVNPMLAGYGSHNCQLIVNDPNAVNGPQVVTVTLDVLRPEIGVLPASIDFECDVDEPNVLTDVLSISNSGYDVLNWELSKDCDWLSVDPVSGQCVSGQNEVVLTVDTAGSEIGFYDCELTITDDNASNSPVAVPVSLHVYRDGERHVPTEYPTIQQAIDAAVDGDHIVIHPGRYYESCLVYKNITIRSVDPEDMEIVASTIITGANRKDFYLDAGVGPALFPVIDGLIFSNYQYGVITSDGCTPTIRNCVFRDNNASWAGVLECNNSSALVENCTFIANSGYSIVSLYEYSPDMAAGGIHVTTFRNCLFAENTMQIEPSACIRIDNTSAVFENCTIANNYAIGHYRVIPGIACFDGNVSLTNSIIQGNRGLYSELDGTLLIYETHQVAIVDDEYLGIPKCTISHSEIEGGQDSIMLFPYALYNSYYYDYLRDGILPDPNLVDPNMLSWGQGNMDVDPLFVREPNDGGDGWGDNVYTSVNEGVNDIPGDYHLKSQAGRFVWDGFARADFNMDRRVDLIDFSGIAQIWGMSASSPHTLYPYNLNGDVTVDLEDFILFCEDYLQPRVFGAWVVDDVTSPCIDAGDPADIGWQNELWPHGGRVNMGAYGGTAAASMSLNDVGNPADLNHDNAVDMIDWSLWTDHWLDERVLLDSDFDRNNVVDPNDMTIFMNNWLWAQ